MLREDTERESFVTVEWWDTACGVWADLGEARSVVAARHRIVGLIAADEAPQRYRIVETNRLIVTVTTDGE